MGRQQELFQFQGKQIHGGALKIKAPPIPAPPVGEGERVEILIAGVASRFVVERDADGRLIQTITIVVDDHLIVPLGTFEKLEAEAPAKALGAV